MPDLPKLTILRTGADDTARADVPPLLHIHIPKCAGTTLDHILAAAAQALGRPGIRFLGTIYGQGFSGLGKQEAWRQGDGFAYPPGWLYASGHVPFGRFPRSETEPDTLCLIRDPLARLVSMVRMGARRGAWAETTPVDEIFGAGLLVADSMVRQLSGETATDRALGPAHVETALRNFASVTYRGSIEDCNAILATILARYGIPYVAYHNYQVGEPADDAARAHLTEALAPYCALDRVFFERAGAEHGWNELPATSIRDVPPEAPVLVVSPYLASKDGQPVGSALLPAGTVARLFGA